MEYKGKNNLIGQKFGKLKVLEYNGEGKWLCQCECGKQSNVKTNSLKSGKTKSCGCLKGQNTKQNLRHTGPRKDITGQRFGKLIALEYIKGGFWLCQCDCGKITKVDTRNLNSGHTQSCGCWQKEVAKQNVIDMSEYEDDNFKVLERDGSSLQGIAHWKCLCKHCGNIFTTKGSSIRSVGISSCGCMHSSGERAITKMLLEANCDFKTQYTFPDLKGINGGALRFDFAIFKQGQLSHLIEFNGKQHYEKVPGKWGDYFEIQKKNDLLKQDYCQKHNIELRIIKYDDDYSLKDII